MKAHRSSSLFIAILLVMSVFNLPLNVLAAHQDETAATLRGNAVVGQEQEHRMLPKGGNTGGGGGGGGGGQNKNNESITPAPTASPTPAQTNAVTPAPTASPTPAQPPAPTTPTGYPAVPWNSCGTRPPTTPSPNPAPTPPTCENPDTCGNKGPYCCDGWTCSKGKNGICEAARRNLRVEQAKSFPFQTSVADASHRKLDQCTSTTDSCNEHNNPVLCDVNGDIPSHAKDTPSIICNYATNVAVQMTVDPCESNDLKCCEDGNGGYYEPRSCWSQEQQCCPKGYTKAASFDIGGCIPLNCCDAKDSIKQEFCPQC